MKSPISKLVLAMTLVISSFQAYAAPSYNDKLLINCRISPKNASALLYSYLTVKGAATTGSILEIQEFKNLANQRFTLVYKSDYSSSSLNGTVWWIKAEHSKQCLTSPSTEGSKITQASCDLSTPWILTAHSDGTRRVSHNREPIKAWDMENKSNMKGTDLQVWGYRYSDRYSHKDFYFEGCQNRAGSEVNPAG
jgi:hypothetical protein